MENNKLSKVIVKNGIMYHLAEDECYYPDFGESGDTSYPIGKYGLMKAEEIWENNRREYHRMVREGCWNKYLHEFDEECHQEVERAVKRIMEKEGVTEELKRTDQLEWVRRVNMIRARVEEDVWLDSLLK